MSPAMQNTSEDFRRAIASAKEEAQRVEQEEERLAASLAVVRNELSAKSEQNVAREKQLSRN